MINKNIFFTFCTLFILITGMIAVAHPLNSPQKEYASFKKMLASGKTKFPPGYVSGCMALLEKTKKQNDGAELAAAYALAGMAKLRIESNPEEASGYLYNAHLNFVKTKGNYNAETIELKSALLEVYDQLSDFEKEKAVAFDLLGHYLKDSVKYVLEIAGLFNTIGINYGYSGERLSEQEYLQKSKAILEKFRTDDKAVFSKSQMVLGASYNSLSVSYFNLRDYQNAILYSKKSLQILNATSPGHAKRAINLMYIGRSIYEQQRNPDSALAYLNEALQIIENADPTTGYGKGSPEWISWCSYKSEILLREGKTDAGISFSKSVIEFVKKNNLLKASIAEIILQHYLHISNAYLDQDNLKPALKSCQEADAMIKRFSSTGNLLSSLLYSQHAKVLYKLYRWKDAEVYFNKALQPVNLSIAALKKGKWVVDVSIPSEFLETIKDAGDYFLFRGFARTNKENIRIGIEVLNKVVKASVSQQNFLFDAGINEGFGRINPDLFEDLLLAHYKSRNILDEDAVMAHAFTTIEAAKADLLKNVVWEEEKLSAILPDSVNRKRLDMKNEVRKAMSKVRENNNTMNQSSFVDKRERYMEYLRKIKKEFSFDEIKNTHVISANDLRLTQYKGTVMNYFLGEKNLYIFIHSNFRKYFVCKKIPETFEKDLTLVRNTYLTKPALTEIKYVEDLKRISKQWYQWLLSNVAIYDDLVIIPHGQLSLISFEMLDANEKGREISYVLEKHPVRYELSASLMFSEHNKKKVTNLKPFAGFAASNFNLALPDTNSNDLRSYLIGNENEFLFGTAEEVKAVSEIMSGDAYINTKPFTFLSNAGNYKVLHIATHAFSDQGPFHECNFLFETDSTGKSIVRDIEIASMKLNARMTVLSACNTGYEPLQRSEGMISIARSFFTAGCPSVVMGLWTVNDPSTAKIMTAFYTYLKKGQTKSEALRNAKFEYLKNETNPSKKHPYYWAGFIVTGNNDPLPSRDFLKKHWGKIVITIGVIFIVLLYLRIRSGKA